MSVEKIVRPFQAGDVFDARVLAPSQPAFEPNTDEASLTWKGSAKAEYNEEPAPMMLGFTAEWAEDTGRRITEQVRVTNPKDSDQYVDVERIKQMVFKNQKTGEELPLKMNWS